MALWRPCLICNEPTKGTYCDVHRPTTGWERPNRPSQSERGYGPAHSRERRRVKKIVDSGNAICSRCFEPIAPGADFHLDHADDRSEYLGPSHPECNHRAASRKGYRTQRRHSSAEDF